MINSLGVDPSSTRTAACLVTAEVGSEHPYNVEWYEIWTKSNQEHLHFWTTSLSWWTHGLMNRIGDETELTIVVERQKGVQWSSRRVTYESVERPAQARAAVATGLDAGPHRQIYYPDVQREVRVRITGENMPSNYLVARTLRALGYMLYTVDGKPLEREHELLWAKGPVVSVLRNSDTVEVNKPIKLDHDKMDALALGVWGIIIEQMRLRGTIEIKKEWIRG